MKEQLRSKLKNLRKDFGWQDPVIFVVVFTLLAMISLNLKIEKKPFSLGRNAWTTVKLLIPIYIHHLVLVRRLFDKGKFGKYIISAVLYCTGLIMLSLLLPSKNDLKPGMTYNQYVFQVSLGHSVLLLLGLTTLFIKRGIFQTQVKLKNQVLIHQMEMKLLKAQLNPHFLFNSLNNIYALSLDSLPETSDTILKLSELMRYQLQSSKKQTVLLEDELNFIRNYIDLEKIRLTEKSDVQLHIEGEPFKAEIAPMLLIPFIENSFKHGINTIQDNYVHIFLHINDNHLSFDIQNSIPPQKNKRISTKIGLDNTQRRLDLLYKNRYDLKINAENNTFKVHLELALD